MAVTMAEVRGEVQMGSFNEDNDGKPSDMRLWWHSGKHTNCDAAIIF